MIPGFKMGTRGWPVKLLALKYYFIKYNIKSLLKYEIINKNKLYAKFRPKARTIFMRSLITIFYYNYYKFNLYMYLSHKIKIKNNLF